jgi:hypothetical protein
MALIPDGGEVETETGVTRSGKDMEGKRVVVSASHEAVEDYGWRTIWGAGETKYLRGLYEVNGESRVVRVKTADCAEEEAE